MPFRIVQYRKLNHHNKLSQFEASSKLYASFPLPQIHIHFEPATYYSSDVSEMMDQ